MTACPGPCSSRAWQMALDHNAALDAWREALTRWENARTDAVDAGDSSVVAALDTMRPQRPAPPEVTFTPGDPVFCPRCHAAIRRALVELDDLAALLESWSDGHRGASSGERTSTRRPGTGSPSPIADTLDELYQALARVEADWRDARGLPPRPHRAGPEARARTVAWLLGQLDQILMHPASAAFGRATLKWLARLQKLSKTDPVVRRRPAVPCPRCDRRALRTRDDGYTQCGKCGRLMDEDEYDELAEAAEVRLAAEEREAS